MVRWRCLLGFDICLIAVLTFWGAAFGGVGCSHAPRDVTNDPRYAKYQTGATYELLTVCKLVRARADEYGTGTTYFLLRPGGGERALVPDDITERGAVGPGTRLQILKLLACRTKLRAMRWIEVVRPVARIASGPYAGTVVDLTDISRYKPAKKLDANVAAPASEFLARVHQ